MAGTTINPYRFGGQLGYRRDGPNRLYIRERQLDTTRGRWLSKDPIGTDSGDFNFYWYARNNSVNNFDPTGLITTKPNCYKMRDCLAQKRSPCSCGRKTHHTISTDLILCVFWQETSFGQQQPPGGIGSCTRDCFDELKRTRSCWITKFGSYSSFVRNATDCEKAQAAADFMGCIGLDRYGPGPGRPGDYRGPTGQKVRQCEHCLQQPIQCGLSIIDVPILVEDLINSQCKQCFKLVHS